MDRCRRRVHVPAARFTIGNSDSVVAASDALDRFATVDPEKAELVRLRYFVGLTIEETAATMDMSIATAKRHWVFSRAWLAREMKR